MSVTGYLALYTTLLGWQQYQNLWAIMVGTGLIYLPFIGIVITSVAGPYTSMGAKDAAVIAIRRLIINLLVAVMVLSAAGVPAVNLTPKVLHFEPLCSKEARSATPGDTGTTYDSAFPIITGTKIPLLWYVIMAVSNGITHAANTGFSCTAIDYRALQTQVNTARIEDPKLKKEVEQFYSDCYAPAYSTYMQGSTSKSQQDQIQQAVKKNGAVDLGWLGSQTLQTVPGFYDAHKASNSIEGFPFDSSRDYVAGQVGHPQWGSPTCREWWSDATYGLQAKLAKALPPTFWEKFTHVSGDKQALNTVVIQSLLEHNFTPTNTVRGYESYEDNEQGDYLTRFVGEPLGIGLEGLSFFPKIHLLMNTLPIIQATLLFLIYALLAVALPLSGYRVGFCVTASVVLFSVTFCSYLWHLVQWFDNQLLQSLYGNLAVGTVLKDFFISGMRPLANQQFVDMVIKMLYVVAPFVWLTITTWAGHKAGAFINGVINPMTTPGYSAGEKSAQAGKTIVSTVI